MDRSVIPPRSGTTTREPSRRSPRFRALAVVGRIQMAGFSAANAGSGVRHDRDPEARVPDRPGGARKP